MTPQEVNRTIEFLLEHSARFAVHMEKLSDTASRHDKELEALARGLNNLRESTDRFQSLTAEIVSIQSRRLDQNDELLHRILEKLP